MSLPHNTGIRLSMISDEHLNFSISGPLHLSTIGYDWKNQIHRRSILASLTQGVRVHELDRQKGRQGTQALGPPWWESFDFKLNRPLVDENDLSFFGAIYEFKFSPSPNSPPKYVIAFRGTLMMLGTMVEDIKLNLKACHSTNGLELSSRFQLAIQAVEETVSLAGAANVWLTGHSLGSAIALLAGKNMAKMGIHLKTFLFNPPFISAPIETMLEDEELKSRIRFTTSLFTAALAAVNSLSRNDQEDETFAVLSSWVPHLFVNISDPICAEYIAYFEQREKMDEYRLGGIERLATKHSIGSLISGMMGNASEAFHLLPSAHLTVNLNSTNDYKAHRLIVQREAHTLRQWWTPDSQCESKLHLFNSK